MSAGHTNKRRHVGAPAASAGIGTQAATPLPVPGSDDELMPRARAAALLSDLWGGVRVAQRSLASLACAVRIIGHASLYRRGDLVQYARRKLENAPVRTGGGMAAVRRA